MKNTLTIIVLIVVLFIATAWWSKSRQENDPEVIAAGGLHWHPELAIYVKGQKQEISPNIGIGVVHQPLHTHDSSGTLHLEFSGLVRRKDIMLGQFFKSWGRDFWSFGSSTFMTVNGKENTEFENYVMHDGDKIELRYN